MKTCATVIEVEEIGGSLAYHPFKLRRTFSFWDSTTPPRGKQKPVLVKSRGSIAALKNLPEIDLQFEIGIKKISSMQRYNLHRI